MWTVHLCGVYQRALSNGQPTCHTDRVTDDRRDRHAGHRRTFRPPDADYEDALNTLRAHDWTMNEFLIACLVMAAKNPRDMLKSLAATRPQLRRGRPPKPQRHAEPKAAKRTRFEEAP